jgi:site-specific DNA-methyltransferase (adenine-specific)
LIVYDPFIGIGTTALACMSLNVKYIGTEMDSQYVRIANENLISRGREIRQGKRKRRIIDYQKSRCHRLWPAS